ncbi:MAG: class I SAM-dependent methyltransferase [bacterium]
MNKNKFEEINNVWNELAADWEIHIGKDGDANRRLNSDPVLWEFAGDVKDLFVLDAGCGTGYLSQKLREKGAKVTGIDLSEKMIELAKKNNPQIDFFVGSCSVMSNIQSDYFDVLIANYVIMDTPELQETIDEFYRVLKPKGKAILIFSHPCFPQDKATLSETNNDVNYLWDYPYFTPIKRTEPPWGNFKTNFIWFHRSLSDYWKAFKSSGFHVIDFEEPRLTPDRYHLAKNPNTPKYAQYRPYSVAFKLRK